MKDIPKKNFKLPLPGETGLGVRPKDAGISLNRFISQTGFCSRREADKLIDAGRVTINGSAAKSGNRVMTGELVLVDGETLKQSSQTVYIAFNKPPGVSSTTDLKDKDNIIDFIKYPLRIFPIGRLDKASEGLIFLTNDGDIVNKILRAGNRHEKEYIVTVDKPITKDFIYKMSNGIKILDTVTQKCRVTQQSTFVFKIILTQGLNRQIRRMCAALNYKVKRLVRTRIMTITLQNIAAGKWRPFSQDEIEHIHQLIQDSSKTKEASLIYSNNESFNE
ncbi:MAG: 23S rRNA pseudouridine(2604) synthase RluF [Ginsengibacter sp.]